MRYIFALILLLPAGLSLADTENRVAISEERVQSELTVLSVHPKISLRIANTRDWTPSRRRTKLQLKQNHWVLWKLLSISLK